ncbi:glycoside hydrolase family 53 protein [Nonlabens ulvanivorans]|uniref:Arabinogalactan endo-beta-1,4-galactanase n=1 Tax=Nonlabens ulvanivorans TaxID=906888 RepID=A0A084JZ64_NONUL|nr:glycosyl hydrolase 53 family protein [Nonlabens ulvanivorans]KEZ94248.1 arabinogalactan endo-1, 4-beta-galactosidase [Nonlabens ulvanivorans]PRX13238.1 arabinogalactan endo-1,4-beta-galactosidase [Nonlabens ulvanivorans]
MKKCFYPFLVFLLLISCTTNDNDRQPEPESIEFYKGMDLSFLPEIESDGVVFKDENSQDIVDNYAYLKSRGVNLVRIRLWINNTSGLYNLNFVKDQALKAKAQGMDFLLDFHYSDNWADPGSQDIPMVWATQNITSMTESIKNYSQNVLQELVLQDTSPAIVQIGNETNNGMLWPLGQIYSSGGENWDNYIQLTKAAIEGVLLASPESQIMIHHAGIEGADFFYEQLVFHNVNFDIAGLSYYPWWHNNDIDFIENQLQSFAIGISQKIMIVETAYPFTLNWDDNTNNIVGLQDQLIASYPATPVGQRTFMLRIHNMMKNLPNDKGLGYCYWAPDWVAHHTGSSSQTSGSSWENLALFNFNYEANTALEIYELD